MSGCCRGSAFLIGFLTLLTIFFLTTHVNTDTCKIIQHNSVVCEGILTSDAAVSALQVLQKSLNRTRSWTFHFNSISVDTMPNDFFTSLHVQVSKLYFFMCRMRELPYHLIDSVSDSLTYLRIHRVSIDSKTIPSSGFHQNKGLRMFSATHTVISTIQSRAFLGLSNIQELQLYGNHIERIDRDAFHGLGKLEILDISGNNLKTLDEGIFNPVEQTITWLHLEDNNFQCDCNLQWLQNWVLRQKAIMNINSITCKTPNEGDFTTLNFCRSTTPLPVTTTSSATTTALLLAPTNETPKPNVSCRCLIQKLAAALNSFQKCSTTEEDKTTKFCNVLQDTPPPSRSSSSATREEKKCDCILGKLLAKSIMKQNCPIRQDDQCMKVCITRTPTVALSSSELYLETHYKCHLEKTLAKINLQWNCANAQNWTSFNYCKFTTTPLPSAAKAETIQANNQSPRDNLLSSPFCAGIARLQTISSKC